MDLRFRVWGDSVVMVCQLCPFEQGDRFFRTVLGSFTQSPFNTGTVARRLPMMASVLLFFLSCSVASIRVGGGRSKGDRNSRQKKKHSEFQNFLWFCLEEILVARVGVPYCTVPVYMFHHLWEIKLMNGACNPIQRSESKPNARTLLMRPNKGPRPPGRAFFSSNLRFTSNVVM